MGQDRRDEQELKSVLTSVYREVVSDMRADRLLGPFLPEGAEVYVIAIGKAALGMAAQAAKRCLVVDGIVVSPVGGIVPGMEVLVGGHPLPTEASLDAGRAVMDFAERVPRGATVIGLLSGGASALADDLEPIYTLEKLRKETEEMMRAGAGIHELNDFRKSVSFLKDGGIGRTLDGCPTTAFVLSDVHLSDFSVIGSGPFWTDEVPHVLIGDAAIALEKASSQLTSLGFRVRQRPWIDGEAREEGEIFGRQALTLASGEALVAVGEPVVTVQGDGSGGRAQEFAMGAARMISGEPGVAVLAAGTDGRDGPTDAAGAVVDGRSWDGEALGDLLASDSAVWARRAGARIPAWVTGTNVNDLFLAVRK